MSWKKNIYSEFGKKYQINKIASNFFIVDLKLKKVMRSKITFEYGYQTIFLSHKNNEMNFEKCDFNPRVVLKQEDLSPIIDISDDEDCVVVNNKTDLMSNKIFYSSR